MRILFLARRYFPEVGGVETHLAKLNQQLLQQSKKTHINVLTEKTQSNLNDQEQYNGVTIKRIPLPNQQTNKWAIWQWIWQHKQLFVQADVIHIHDVFFWILPIYPWLKLINKKIFITFHGYEGNHEPNWRQRAWHQLANFLTNGSIAIGGFHEKWYHIKPTVTSFGAAEIAPTRNSKKANSRKKNKKREKRIIYAGRLSQDVGILTYLKALRILSANSAVQLDVYGDGPQQNTAQEFVKKYKLPVRFFGFIPGDKIDWHRYDYAFVSRYLAIIEAMQAGLPVIGQYNSPIKKDYLQLSPFSDWIMTGQSAAEIADGFKKTTEKDFHKRLKQAQNWSKQQTWKKMTNLYLKLWQK